jgi:hypothetical protein
MPDDVAQARQARVASLLEDNIRTELQAQNATAGLGLPQEAIARLARGIAAEVLYAFEVDWSPDWVGPGQAHTWQESGDFFARCPACLGDSPPAKSREDAAAWAASHQAAHGPAQSNGSPESGR